MLIAAGAVGQTRKAPAAMTDLTKLDIGGFRLGGDLTASIHRFAYLEAVGYSPSKKQRVSAVLRRAGQSVDNRPEIVREYSGNLQETRPEGRVNILVEAAGDGRIHKITYTLKGKLNVAALEKEWVEKFGPPAKKDGDLQYWGCQGGAGLDLLNGCVLIELNAYQTEVRASDARIMVEWSRDYDAKVAEAKAGGREALASAGEADAPDSATPNYEDKEAVIRRLEARVKRCKDAGKTDSAQCAAACQRSLDAIRKRPDADRMFVKRQWVDCNLALSRDGLLGK